jgi:hypothetical protein
MRRARRHGERDLGNDRPLANAALAEAALAGPPHGPYAAVLGMSTATRRVGVQLTVTHIFGVWQ